MMSRPTSSLPKGCASDGGARNSVGSTRLAADSGISSGPMTHTPTIAPNSAPPARARRCRRKRRQASADNVWVGLGSVIANARVEVGIRDVREQVEDDDQHR